MEKDKEWLKNEVFIEYNDTDFIKIVWDLIDQLDEPEITEEQAWRVIAETHNQDEMYWLDAKNHYLNSSNKPELPVIPQFVADWIKPLKGFHLGKYIREMEENSKVNKWFTDNREKYGLRDCRDLLAMVKIHGYNIEPEKKVKVAIGKLDGTYFRTELPESEARKLIEGWKGNE